jgi:hypothetical protein
MINRKRRTLQSKILPKNLSLYITKIVQFLNKYGMQKGIFGQSGNLETKKIILEALKKGKYVKPKEGICYDYANMLKDLLREYEQPILSVLYDKIIKKENHLYDKEYIRSILTKEKKINIKIMGCIMELLNKISNTYYEKTKMGTTALSIVFLPCIYCKDIFALIKNKEKLKIAKSLTIMIIQEYDYIF